MNTYCDQHTEIRDMLIRIDTRTEKMEKDLSGIVKYKDWMDRWVNYEKIAGKTILLAVITAFGVALIWLIKNGAFG